MFRTLRGSLHGCSGPPMALPRYTPKASGCGTADRGPSSPVVLLRGLTGMGHWLQSHPTPDQKWQCNPNQKRFQTPTAPSDDSKEQNQKNQEPRLVAKRKKSRKCSRKLPTALTQTALPASGKVWPRGPRRVGSSQAVLDKIRTEETTKVGYKEVCSLHSNGSAELPNSVNTQPLAGRS